MKKAISLLLVAIMLILSLASCNIPSKPDTPEPPAEENPGGTTDTPMGNLAPSEEYETPAPVYATGDSEEDDFINLFSPDVLVEIEIDISSEQLALLQSDYEHYSSFGSKSPIYRMADLTVKMTLPNGDVKIRQIPEVGVRMKGNTSRTSFYNTERGIYNLIHLKLDFGETFDDEEYYGSDAKVWADSAERKARKNRTFATLEKIDLRWNKEDDATYIREIYSYDAYREAGVLAPHVNLASLDMGGEHLGIYTVNEPIDDIFLEKNLPEALLGGDLYKCGWGIGGGADFKRLDSIGIEDEDNALFYAYDLKTNKKTSKNEALKYFITEINKSGLSKDRIAELIDMESFISFAAVSWFLGNPDDLRNNYNNFYVYFTPEGKAMFIPYDYDRSMGISHDWNPTGHGMTKDNPFTKKTSTGQNQVNPVYLYTVVSGGHYVTEYTARLTELAESNLFSNAKFSARYEKAKALYGDKAMPLGNFDNAGSHTNRFDITITADPSDPNGNISYSDYFKLKYETLNKALSNEEPIYYIRASFTNWEISEDHVMTMAEKGTYVYTLTVSSETPLKIYDINTEKWIGQESVDKDHSASFTTDGHGNIILPRGTYVLKYDSNAKIVTIIEQ
jgi:spore coat protein CotH